MREIGITSEATLYEWLEQNDFNFAVEIANRAALRTLPNIVYSYTPNNSNWRSAIALSIFRAIHTSILLNSIYLPENIINNVSEIAHDAAATYHPDADYAALSIAFALDTAAGATDLSAHSVGFGIHSLKKDDQDWSTVESDISILSKNHENSQNMKFPLWATHPPEWAVANWNHFKKILRKEETEDWDVWIDWYERQLAGLDYAYANLALEEAILLIPDAIWEAGPKIANAEIRRLMQEYSRETLDELVSPEPVIAEGKVTVAANAVADVPDDLAAILDLPERLREAISDLLDMLAIKGNACPVVLPPLTRYRDHLDRYGPRPMLDSLNDRYAVVKDEFYSLHRERFFDAEGGLRRAFLTFLALHRQFRSEFAKSAVREQAIRMYRFDRDAIDAQGLGKSIDAFEQGAKDAVEAEAATPEFLEYASELSEAMRSALSTPEPGPSIDMDADDPSVERAANEKLWPVRILMKGGAFAGRLYRLLTDPVAAVGSIASIVAFLDSERGARMMRGLREIRDAIFGSDDEDDNG